MFEILTLSFDIHLEQGCSSEYLCDMKKRNLWNSRLEVSTLGLGCAEPMSLREGYHRAPAEYFTGTAWVKILIVPNNETDCTISDVVFEPGARNNWHKHPSNQILIVTEGEGYYQEQGLPIQKLSPGNVVNVLPGVIHWHGASPDSGFTHIAINVNSEKETVNWLEPVSDEEYVQLAEIV